MSTPRLKFPSDSGFHAELKRRVQAYFDESGVSPRGSALLYLDTTARLLWFGGSYALLVFAAATWWQAVPLALLLALAMASIGFGVQHDANHGAYCESATVNRLIGMTLDLLGASSYVWRWKHNIAHHTYTNLDGADSDIDIPFTRLSPAQPHRSFHRFQQLYVWGLYGVFVLFWHLYEDFAQLAGGRIAQRPFPRPRGWRLVELIAGKLLFAGWAFVVPMLFHPWWVVLSFYAGISVVLGLMLTVVFELAHCVEETRFPQPLAGTERLAEPWAVHQVHTTANFGQRSRLLTWYLGGLNHQIEHHLFPRVCHVHYPQLATIVEATCREFGVRYAVNESLLGAIGSHWRWLGRMARRPVASRSPSSS